MVDPGHGDGRQGTLPASVVVSVVLLLVAVLGAVTFLTYEGKPVSNLIVVVGTIIVPTVTALMAVRNSQQIASVNGKVDDKIDNLITDKSHLETQVANAGMVPITSKVSFDPETTGPINRVPTDTVPHEAVSPRHRAT